MPSEDTLSDAAYCAALARSDDRDRYLAAQFAPPRERARLLALLAVNAEIARIPSAAREPLLAEMRFKWWHDAVMAALARHPQDSPPRPDRGAMEYARQDSPPRQPALAAFARAAGESGLSADRLAGPFERLIVARMRDIGAKPPRGEGEAVARAEATSGAIVEAALVLIGVADEAALRAARAAGIAHALAETAGAAEDPIRALIREHVARARADMARVPRSALPVLLWATAAETRARRPAPGRPGSSPWLPLRLAWRAWRGRY